MARPPLLEEPMKLKTREGDAPILEADSYIKKVGGQKLGLHEKLGFCAIVPEKIVSPCDFDILRNLQL
jgi:hypothetical protein